MRAAQATLWSLLFMSSLCGCQRQSTRTPAHKTAVNKEARPLSLQEIVNSLGAKDATTTSVATAVGTLGQRDADEYKLRPRNPDFGEGRLAAPAEHHTAPPYIHFYLPVGGRMRLQNVQPGCSPWAKVPGPPEASPFRYGCHLPAKAGALRVNLLATLSESSESSDARVEQLLLQRVD